MIRIYSSSILWTDWSLTDGLVIEHRLAEWGTPAGAARADTKERPPALRCHRAPLEAQQLSCRPAAEVSDIRYGCTQYHCNSFSLPRWSRTERGGQLGRGSTISSAVQCGWSCPVRPSVRPSIHPSIGQGAGRHCFRRATNPLSTTTDKEAPSRCCSAAPQVQPAGEDRVAQVTPTTPRVDDG